MPMRRSSKVFGGGVLYERTSLLQWRGARARACVGSSALSEYLREMYAFSPVTGRCDRGGCRALDRRGGRLRRADSGPPPRRLGQRSGRCVLSAVHERAWQHRGIRDRSAARRGRGAAPRSPRLAPPRGQLRAGRAETGGGNRAVEWLAGDPSLREELLAAIARLESGDGVEWLRQRERRRRLARVPLSDGRSCFAKHYLDSDRHGWRD